LNVPKICKMKILGGEEMARPTKSAKVLTEYSQTKEEIEGRIRAEEKLRGVADNISPPDHLNARQKKIFNYIVDELEASGILGNLDVYILETCVFALDRKQQIQRLINKNPENEDKEIAKLDKYTKIFFRCCNELSLSPQSRAKLGNINIEKKIKEDDPLLQALAGDGD
jgi:P27 family predicted phage terminase small subunit